SSSFFFHDTPTTALYTLSLHDALPISPLPQRPRELLQVELLRLVLLVAVLLDPVGVPRVQVRRLRTVRHRCGDRDDLQRAPLLDPLQELVHVVELPEGVQRRLRVPAG